jgi:hypothetical protein
VARSYHPQPVPLDDVSLGAASSPFVAAARWDAYTRSLPSVSRRIGDQEPMLIAGHALR